MIKQFLTALSLLIVTVMSAHANTNNKIATGFTSIIEADPAVRSKFAQTFSQHKPAIRLISKGVYLAAGFGQGSAVILEGDDGLVVFDVGDSYEHGQMMRQAMREYTDKPVKAVIYSHFHFDHIFGGKAWLEGSDSDAQIIAHESSIRFLDERVSALAPRTDWGLAMQFGLLLDETCSVGSGPLCSAVNGIQFPRIGSSKGHRRHVIYPTRTFRDQLTLQIAGLDIQLIHSPSETPDNIILWLPSQKVVATGDSLTPTLPPIFTARGQRVRDPDGYLKSLDLMRSLKPDHVIPSHGPAFSGTHAKQVLQNYRDAVAFMYHQTVRLINKGMGPEAIASELQLPAHLRDNMFLGQWYNDLQTNIRGIYGFLVGHYGDVSEMPLLTPTEADRSMIALAGGPAAYLEKLHHAYARGDYVFTARAASHLIRMEAHNQDAKNLKAKALRKLAAETIAGSHRHFYLQHAAALEGLIDINRQARFTKDDVSSVPASALIQQLPFRLNAKKAAKENRSLSIALSDTGQMFTLHVRNGVAEVSEATKEKIALFELSSEDMRLLYIGEKNLKEITGKQQVHAMFSLFDWPQ